ncbi:MAG TPA: HK97 family phage prohead protease [Jatrophihabitantaceae bacterium]|jgi:hypothetical protein
MTERPLLHRSFVGSPTAGEGRTIVAPCVVPYNRAMRVADFNLDGSAGQPYDEMFVPGVFRNDVGAAHRVLVRAQHTEGFLGIVGRAAALHDGPNELGGEFLALDTPSGEQALGMVRAGIFTGMSVGFEPIVNRRGPRGEIVRTRARLDHVALVLEPAYPEAGALTVRSDAGSDDRVDLDELRPPANDDLERRLRDLGLRPA